MGKTLETQVALTRFGIANIVSEHTQQVIFEGKEGSSADLQIDHVHQHQWTFDRDDVTGWSVTLTDLVGTTIDKIAFVHVAYFVTPTTESPASAVPKRFRVQLAGSPIGSFSEFLMSNLSGFSSAIVVDTLDNPAEATPAIQYTLIITIGTNQ